MAPDPSARYAALVQELLTAPGPSVRELLYPDGATRILVHHAGLAELLRPVYNAAELASLAEWLEAQGTTRLALTANGLLRAAERVGEDEADPIRYDAVWVRDAAWGALALLATPGRLADGARLVHELLRSFATPLQLARFDAVIAEPGLAAAGRPEAGMNVVHIRFDGRSPSYADVCEGDEAKGWNHKQNDALGLFLIALDEANQRGAFDPSSLAAAEWQALLRFGPYFEAIAYERFEDAGAWEEIERLNTSSIGIVSHALELLAKGLAAGELPLYIEWRRRAQELPPELARCNDPEALQSSARRGLAVVKGQLAGGESPDYPPGSPQRRGADAALLSLIAPAPLCGLDSTERWLLLAHVDSLIRPTGVLRYVGDSYQAANAWFLAPWPEAAAARTALTRGTPTAPLLADAATASGQAFVERARGFMPGTEAQWFFDSWIAWARAELYLAEGEPADLAVAFKHLNRALGQVTAARAPLGADGRPGQAAVLPESYNTIVLPDGARAWAPSPVMPLNWSKASLLLALAALQRAVAKH